MRHTIPGMMKKRLSMLLAIAFVVGAVMSPSSALADEDLLNCGTGGFRGTLRVTADDPGFEQNVRLYYTIKAPSRYSHRRKANVDVWDRGIHIHGIDDARQDNVERLFYGPYDRDSGLLKVRFIFDKPFRDPRCSSEKDPAIQ